MAARKKPAKKTAKPASERGAGPKGVATRLRVIQAAREVFTTTSFQAAGIRAIAQKAGVPHPLVIHYFKSKNALFEEVATEIQNEILEGHPGFFSRLQTLGADTRKAVYLEGILRQGLRRPDAYRVMLLNAVEMVSPDAPLPGLDRMARVHEKVLSLVARHILEQTPAKETAMFMIVFMLVAVHFIGGRAFHQKTLGLKDKEYEDWVKNTLVGLFTPVLDVLSRGRAAVPAEYMSRWPGNRPHSPDKSASPGQEGRTAPMPKGEITKKRILDAARRVFTTCPYDSATIRRIGQAGKFDFSRIHHFFPTKSALFEAVIQDTFESFVDTIEGWQQGAEGLPPEEVFIHYLQQGLAYCFENREMVGTLVINIAHYDNHRHVSGFTLMTRVHSNMLKMVEQSVPPGIPAEDVSRWLYAIVMMGYTFAGAPAYPARIMGLDPDSDAYRKKVFEILCFVFLPSLRSRL